jgi:dTDP-glucose pyrophosphorylase
VKDVSKITIQKNTSIREGMRVIDDGGLRIALVVDEAQQFFGVITDGDIRRGLLAGYNLDAAVSLIANRNPIIGREGETMQALKQRAQKASVNLIPILSDTKKVLRLIILNEVRIIPPRANRVVLMAGGLGTRLRPLTETVPKPMLRVGNKPILEHIIENLKRSGLVEIDMCVSYKSHVIQDYFQDGAQFGVNITYLEEETRMGTAGALQLLARRPTGPFIVMNGDLLTNMDFTTMLEYHESERAFGTMGVREFEYQVPYGVVQVDQNQIKSIQEKPVQTCLVSAGIYVLSPEAISLIPKGEYFDMPDLFTRIIEAQHRAVSFLIKDYWLDIGRISDYEKAQAEIDIVLKKREE